MRTCRDQVCQGSAIQVPCALVLHFLRDRTSMPRLSVPTQLHLRIQERGHMVSTRAGSNDMPLQSLILYIYTWLMPNSPCLTRRPHNA